jgi:hypothetical protein
MLRLLVVETIKIIDIDGKIWVGRMRASGRSGKITDETE